MATLSSCFLWNTERLEPEAQATGGDAPIAVADSWLVTQGRVRSLEAHRERFFAAIAPQKRAQLRLDEFWAACLARIPLTDNWFPRVELRESSAHEHRSAHEPNRTQQLAFRLRSAPPLGTTLTVLSHAGADPRRQPGIKGPDLAALGRLRRAAESHGADEAIILSEAGAIVEGTSTAILWWRGDVLCAPPATFARVDSVSAKTLIALATAQGTEIRYEAVRPRELDALEVWAVNALHGIRTITAWIDGPATAAPSARASAWRSRMDALATPLPPPRP
jgi:branched-subunit amino acid aminotransferase/4-amino-4-deoxychorismate lyase